MPAPGRFAFAFLVTVALVAVGCGDPPDKEIQQAQGALDTARAAGADQYAHDEFVAAEDALKHARGAVEERDYRLALNHALDSRERAQIAAKEAADHKALVRTDADRALAGAAAALEEARAKLKAAELARAPARSLIEPRQIIAHCDEAVQKARATFDRGDYLAVTSLVGDTRTRLLATARDLETLARPATKRRR